MTQRYDRRQFLKRAAGVLAVAGTGLALPAAQAAEKLDPADPAAVALGYVEDAGGLDATKEASFKAGSHCANCMLYDASKAEGGHAPCAAFAGKLVSAKGWCRAWAAKPA